MRHTRERVVRRREATPCGALASGAVTYCCGAVHELKQALGLTNGAGEAIGQAVLRQIERAGAGFIASLSDSSDIIAF
jgi:hypothetical protein